MRIPFSLMALALVLGSSAFGQQGNPTPTFDAIRFLIGHWQGTTHGEPGDGTGERTYEFVLRGKFLRGTNRMTYPPQTNNPKGEVHEDVTYFSYDRQQKRMVLR